MIAILSPTRIRQIFRNLNLGYLKQLFSFAFLHYPQLYLCIVVMLASVMFEALAMNAFIPLSEISAGRTPTESNAVIQILSLLHLKSTSPKYIFLAFIVIFALRIILQIIGERKIMQITENYMPAMLIAQSLENVLCHISISEIEKKSIGYYVALTSEQVVRACGTVGTVIRFSSFVLLIALYYYTIAVYSWATAIGVIIFLGISALVSIGILRKVHRIGVALMESSREGNSLFIDALNGVRSIRAFVAEEYVSERHRKHTFQHKHHIFRIGFFTLLGKLFPMLLLVITFGLFILIGTQLSGTAFNYAFAVTLLIFLMRFFLAVGETVNVFLKIISDTKSGQDISEIITARNEAVEILAKKTFQPMPEVVSSITLENVSFAYNPNQNVLQNLSCTFEHGKSYAIIGESGSGKSTLLDLLLKFQRPTEGRILINSTIEMESVYERDLRHHVVMLGQETFILNDTILNNIQYGQTAQMADLQKATRIASVDGVIADLEQQYDTVLQYRGTNLSGGQRQRIGIARALLRCPDVLVLDESMSALDLATRELVTQNILSEYRDKIVIFVSHDPAIREKVDVVIELQKAALVDEKLEQLRIFSATRLSE